MATASKHRANAALMANFSNINTIALSLPASRQIYWIAAMMLGLLCRKLLISLWRKDATESMLFAMRSGLQMYCLSASTSMLLDLTENGIQHPAGLRSQLRASLVLICWHSTCMKRQGNIWSARRYANTTDQKSLISRRTSTSFAIPGVQLPLQRICSRIAGKMWNSFRAMQGWKQSRCCM